MSIAIAAASCWLSRRLENAGKGLELVVRTTLATDMADARNSP